MDVDADLLAARRLVAQARVASRVRESYVCVECSSAFNARRRKPPYQPRYCSNKCKVKAWQRARKAKPSTRISLVSRAQPGE